MEQDNKKQKVTREFRLSSASVNNRTTVFFLTFIILIMGLLGYQSMPIESFPEVELPTIYVGTSYPGNSPEDIENLVTRPLEKEINSISGIDKISSSSVQDYSTIIIEFKSDMSVDKALLEVKDHVDRAKKDLPTDLDQDPIVNEINMGEFPVMFINLSGDYEPDELKEYAEYFKDEIEDFEEISEVHIRGIEEKEVKIFLDLHKMTVQELSFNDVANAIRGKNISISAGNMKTRGGVVKTIKIDGEVDDVRDLGEIIVKHEKGNIVKLKDILAEDIKWEAKELESFARFKQQPVVQLEIIKESGENLIEASNKINALLASVKEDDYTGPIPANLKTTITIDQSNDTRKQVNELENSIISGVILVVVVLLFFLGTRNSLFVGIAIPMSIFLSFMVLSFMGTTINMMVLFGLIMALGMLVDNGIVVVENIYRLMDEGMTPIRAAKEGVGEVAWPIIASTATTLAAFLPLAMWPGIMGEFMKFLPITLIIVLSSSLFVALVINPVFTAVFMRVGDNRAKKSAIFRNTLIFAIASALAFTQMLGNVALIGFLCVPVMLVYVILTYFFTGIRIKKKFIINFYSRWEVFKSMLILLVGGLMLMFLHAKIDSVILGNLLLLAAILILLDYFVLTPLSNRFQRGFIPRLENSYERFLSFSLNKSRPIFMFIGILVLLVISFILMIAFTPKVLFFPESEPRYVNVFIEEPQGTQIEETTELALEIENLVREVIEPYKFMVKAVSTNVGKGTSDPGDPMATSADASTPHKARVNVEFVAYEERNDISSKMVMELIREAIGKKHYPGVTITVEQDRNGPPVGKPINIEISGEDYTVLAEEADKMIALIRSSDIEGYEELKTDLERGKPEIILDVDYIKAGRLGVSTNDIANVVRTALYGSEVSKYKKGEDDYDIEVRLADKYRYDINSLMNQKVTFRSQSDGQIKQIPINAIATVRDTTSLGSIRRKNLDRVVTVFSNIRVGYNATDINNQIKDLLKDHDLPEGYTFKFTGEQEEQAKEMDFMGRALMIALFLILLIIVTQFNRLSAPMIILSSVLFSTIGVLLGLVIFQMEFIIIMTMIGIISLAGIVVNNAIVLLDYTLLLKDRTVEELGGDKSRYKTQHLIENIVRAGKTRLRPVLLTAITTVLGLLPLATGLNIDFFGLFKAYDPNITIGGENTIFWGPMSWTIVFGITFATFLTLVIVPVMLLLVERFKIKLYKRGD